MVSSFITAWVPTSWSFAFCHLAEFVKQEKAVFDVRVGRSSFARDEELEMDDGSVSWKSLGTEDGDTASLSGIRGQLAKTVQGNQDLALSLYHMISREEIDAVSEGCDSSSDSEDDSESSVRTRSGSLESRASRLNFGVDSESPWWERLMGRVAGFGVELMDALSETNEDLKQKKESPGLNVNELRRNVKRSTKEGQIYMETAAGLQDIIYWKYPLYSIMLFCVYMYCVWKGWILTVLLFLFLLQLSFNYLTFRRELSFNLKLLPRKTVSVIKPADSAGAQLVMDVARLAQRFLAIGAELMEKLNNLFTWKRPKVTFRFFLLLLVAFLSSLLVSVSTLATLFGLAVGVQLFILEFLYHRFPKLRNKLDPMVWFFRHLPNNRSICATNYIGNIQRRSGKYTVVNEALQGFRELGQNVALSESVIESRVPKCARNCVLIDKERPFPKTVGSGSLCITSSMVIFKYLRSAKGHREVISLPFSDILAVNKAKSFKSGIFPGSGRAIDVFSVGRQKPYFFVGINKRDDFFAELMDIAMNAQAPFAHSQT